ncbi:MAG: LamG domain-containing protein [Planctomycetota bacterium]|jgi:hypothetical protein
MLRKLVFLISFVVVAFAAGRASAELVARYNFDDGTADDKAYYYEDADGTFFGDAEVVDDAERGKVLDLDGDGDYVKVLNNLVADFSTESFTYTFWANTKFVGDWFYFWKGIDYCGAEGDDLHGVNCYHDDSAWIRFSLYNYSGCDGESKVRTDVPDANCITGQWIHIACVRDAGDTELRFYVNGQLEPTDSEDPNPNTDTVGDVSNTGSLYIGCNDRGYPEPAPNLFFDGMIDDFRAYNHALSEEELEWLVLGLTDPNLASEPAPTDGSQNECIDVVLGWTAGQDAVLHDIYFGTDAQDVRNATTLDAEYRLRQSENSYDAGSLESPVPGQTYYWRIDEVGGASQIWKGDLWGFRINDGKAHSPDPADNKTMVELDKVLSWSPGCNATVHRVFFGTDYDDVDNATTSSAAYKGQKGLAETTYSEPCDFAYSTYYYWRIDEVNGPTTWKGNIWTFKTKGAIIDPNLRVWYKLDETEGAIAADSSGREYDGTVAGTGVWDPDGHEDGCISFNDDGSIIVPTPTLGEIDGEITVVVWLNNAVSSGENTAFEAGADWEDYLVTVAVPDSEHDIVWRAGDDVNDLLSWDRGNPEGWVGAWNHFAFVKNENEGKMGVYVNGLLAAEKDAVAVDTLANIRDRRIKLGAHTDDASTYEGKIDDFRIYDRALSSGEIESIFRGGNLGNAWAPYPTNRAREVSRDVALNWRPGDYAFTHQVYFGTAYDDVNNATTSSGEYKGPRDYDVNNYDPPGDLDFSTTYYWRIDEVNGPNTWKGNLWQFTVANFIIVDDMESYDAIPSSGNEIYDTWDDGFNNGTGAQINLEYGAAGTVHSGTQAMKVGYNNGLPWANHSEIDANTTGPVPGNLSIGTDWTIFGLKALGLFFYGDATNDDTEQMYLVLEDGLNNGHIAKYADNGESMGDIKIAEWQQWNIDLQDFNDAGVDIEDISKIRIGFGDRENPVSGGSGVVFLDDIRLYLPRCVPSILKPQYDFSNNCVVDIADVGIMAEQWLRTDFYLPSPVNPGATGLVGWWKLDENADSTANDSSVYLNHGTISGLYSWVSGHENSAVEFTNGKILVPDAAQLKPPATVSASVWINYSGDPGDSSRVVVKGADNMEAYCIEVSEGEGTFYVGDVNGTRHFADSNEGDVYCDEWVHLAGTYDGATAKLYVNGQVVGTAEVNSIPLSQDTAGLGIANRSDADDRPFRGAVDEVRVYDRALSAAEVAWLATDGSGYVSLGSRVNLYDEEPVDSKVVNFRDMAVLAGSWLEEKLWPAN